MGATDPKKAEKGSIRADFADSIDANAVHDSDTPETAAVEVAFFFPGMQVFLTAPGPVCVPPTASTTSPMCPSCGNILTQNLKGVEPKEFYYKTKNYKILLIVPLFLAVLWTLIPIRWMLKFDDNVYYTNLRNEFFLLRDRKSVV